MLRASKCATSTSCLAVPPGSDDASDLGEGCCLSPSPRSRKLMWSCVRGGKQERERGVGEVKLKNDVVGVGDGKENGRRWAVMERFAVVVVPRLLTTTWRLGRAASAQVVASASPRTGNRWYDRWAVNRWVQSLPPLTDVLVVAFSLSVYYYGSLRLEATRAKHGYCAYG